MLCRFRVGRNKWLLSKDGVLTEHDGDIIENRLRPLKKEKRSDTEGFQTTVTFVNQTNGKVSPSWIDYHELPTQYANIEAGKSDRRKTYDGHVWRVSDFTTKKTLASFVASKDDAVVIVEQYMRSEEHAQIRERLTDDISVSIEDGNGLGHVYPHLGQDPGKLLTAFIRNYNVWGRDVDGCETQISTCGSKDNPFKHGPHHSPQGRFAVASQETVEEEHFVYQIESKPSDQIQPRLKKTQYLKAGDRMSIERPRMFDLLKSKEVPTDNTSFENPYYIWDWQWNEEGTEYYLLYNKRGHKILRFLSMSTNGHIRSIVEDRSDKFIVNVSDQYWNYMKKTDELIYASEKNGWRHLYLCDMKTGKEHQITKGEWVVRSVNHVDDKVRRIWIEAYGLIKGQDLYYAHLARVDFSGSNFTILTSSNGTHTWSWSPSRAYLITTSSRIDSAPETVLRDGHTGAPLLLLQEPDLASLHQIGWTPPERFCAPGRDNETPIYGIIIRPITFSSFKKYPVIEEIYAGPTGFHVPKSFSLLTPQREIAELGFIVVMIDGMGTAWRKKSFHDTCHKNLRDAGFPDRIAWLRAAAKTRPWMDLTRVGIYGGSAGGQNALAALLWHGDFYAAAVADCGCHDNRLDKQWWSEQWMGYPIDESYAENSNVVHAHKLRGKLMLVVGELDSNVDPASTMQVVHALNEAGKDYEFLYLPGKGHCSGGAYGRRRMMDFLVREVMGGETPERNVEGGRSEEGEEAQKDGEVPAGGKGIEGK